MTNRAYNGRREPKMSELEKILNKLIQDPELKKYPHSYNPIIIERAISALKSEFMKAVGKDVENTALGGADSPCYMIPITNGFLYGNERDGMVYNQAKAEIRQKIKEM